MSVEHIITQYSTRGDAAVVAANNKIAASARNAHAATQGKSIGSIVPPPIAGGSGGGSGGNDFGSSIGGMLSGGLGFIGSTAAKAGTALATLSAAFLGAAVVFGAAESRMRASLKSIEGGDAGAILGKLNEIAAMPGISRDEAVKGFVQLRNAGLSRESAFGVLNQTGNANALAGGGGAELSRALMAFSQIALKGKLSQEEILQLSEAGIPGGKLLKKAFGTSDTEELQKRGITGEQAIAGMVKAMEGLPRAADSSANKLENLQVAVKTGIGVFGSGLLDVLAPSLERFGNIISGMVADGSLEALGSTVGESLSSFFDMFSDESVKEGILSGAAALKTTMDLGVGFLHVVENIANSKIFKFLMATTGIGLLAPIFDQNKEAMRQNSETAQMKNGMSRKLGDGAIEGTIQSAIKTILGSQESKANAARANIARGNVLSRSITGGGDIGRLGVTNVELGHGAASRTPIVIHGGDELNKGIKRMVVDLVDQLYKRGQLGSA